MEEIMNFRLLLYNNKIVLYNVDRSSVFGKYFDPTKPDEIIDIPSNIHDFIINYLEININRGYHVTTHGPLAKDLAAEIIIKMKNRQNLSIVGYVCYNGEIVHIADRWEFPHYSYIDDECVAENVQLYGEYISDIIKHKVLFNV